MNETRPSQAFDTALQPAPTGQGYRSTATTVDIYTEHANLFPLTVDPVPQTLYELTTQLRGRSREQVYLSWQEPGIEVAASPPRLARALKRAVVDAFRAAGFKVSRDEEFVYDTRQQRRERGAPFLVPLPAYRFRVLHVGDDLYLCLNHHLVLKNADHLGRLRQLDPLLALRAGQRVHVRDDADGWAQGRFIEEAGDFCRVAVLGDDGAEVEVVVPPALILPELGRDEIVGLAERTGTRATDLERRLKERALLTVSQPAEVRLQLATDFAAYLAERCFPLREGPHTVQLDPRPSRLVPPRFSLRRDLSDPRIALDREDASRRAASILEGLSRYGTYEKPGTAVRLALLAPGAQLAAMRGLVERLNRGGDKYQGAAATFGVRFEVAVEQAGEQQAGYAAAIRELVRRPDAGNLDVVLTYLPRGANAVRHTHPYFLAKKALLQEGLPSQMVDPATLLSPRWKDLNLALNVFAKAGHIPWVLDEGIEDVDLFIGLSYSTSSVPGRAERMMAYVNVFDRYGRWRLYESDAVAFPLRSAWRTSAPWSPTRWPATGPRPAASRCARFTSTTPKPSAARRCGRSRRLCSASCPTHGSPSSRSTHTTRSASSTCARSAPVSSTGPPTCRSVRSASTWRRRAPTRTGSPAWERPSRWS